MAPESAPLEPSSVAKDAQASVPQKEAVTPGPAKDAITAQGTDPAKIGKSDDRSTWIPPHRLKEETSKRQQAEQRAQQFEQELAAERRRVQALAGVTESTPAQREVEEIRQQFARLFPELATLTKEDIEAFRALRTSSDQLQETAKHYWKTHGQSMLNVLAEDVAKELGGELNERQQRALFSAYVQAVSNDETVRERHEQGDITLVNEFAKNWIEDWFEPARRKVTATALDRTRRVPSGKDRALIAGTPKKLDYSNPKAVEDAMVESYREHGGRFGD